MANSERGEVEITLDKPRILKYDFNAWIEIEERLGFRPEDLSNRELKLKDIRFILWAGLIHEDPELTEHQVGAMIGLDNLDALLDQLASAFGLSFEKVEPDPNASREPKLKKSVGTGTSSKR
jgi:hypothetical protein